MPKKDNNTNFLFIAILLIMVIATILAIATYLIVNQFIDKGVFSSSSSEVSSVVSVEISSEEVSSYESVSSAEEDWSLMLVNKDNLLSEDYEPELHYGIWGVHEYSYEIAESIYQPYSQMVQSAKEDGVYLVPCSIYRQYSSQKRNFENRVEQYVNSGYSREEAEEITATIIARPGTSEHQTGLVVDFNPCDESFEYSEEYAWLSAHAEEFGFVQRYKSEKSDITGIIDEPWHYRYVGVEHAKEMNRLDMCLEEYVEYLK